MKLSHAKATRHLAYTEQALLAATGQRRTDLLAKADYLRATLVGRCTSCGRQLQDPVSVARSIGPECVKAAS